MDFTDKVVVITGASSGIGEQTALAFAKYSAKVVLVGRNVDNLNKVAENCEQLNGIEALAITADVTDDDDAKRIVEETLERFGKVDVLVNNAGAGVIESVLNPSLDIFDAAIKLNARAAYNLTSLFAPHLIETSGNVVNISSLVSVSSKPIMVSYGMAKAALDHFTRMAANELAPKGVRVNCINPGLTRTGFQANMMGGQENADNMIEHFIPTIPLGRACEASEIADAVTFFASDLAKSITGQRLVIDGGVTLVL